MCGLGDLGNREVEHNMMRVCHGQGRRSTFPNGKIVLQNSSSLTDVCFQNKSRSALYFAVHAATSGTQ